MAAGDCESIRSALRKKDVDTKVKTLLKSMHVAVRDVRGSESEKDVFRHKFKAMHMWNGCSLFFFTLNPHDIKNPLVLVYLGAEGILKQLGSPYSLMFLRCSEM